MALTDSAQGSKRSAGARQLFLLGFACLATGVGLAAAPHYSWQVTKLARTAAEFGLDSGVFALGGLVLIGLGIVARKVSLPGQDHAQHENPLQPEFHLLNEQLSSKIAQLRQSLTQVADAVGTLTAEQQAYFHKQSDQNEMPHAQHDAVFRLAASLDKLHAHFDERIHSIDLLLRTGFESLLNVSRRSAPRVEVAAHGHEHAQHASQEGSIDFYETMQKLDTIAGPEGHGDQSGNPHPPAPFASEGGKALDALLPEDHERY